MTDENNILDRYEGWIVSRSRKLVRMLGCDLDDARQELSLALVRWESQRTAWLNAKKALIRSKRHQHQARGDHGKSDPCLSLSQEETESRQFEFLEGEGLSFPAIQLAIRIARGDPTDEAARSLGMTADELIDAMTEIQTLNTTRRI